MMEKKTASDLRAHLSGFQPEYPIKKGYISHLILNENLSSANICRKIKEIVQMVEPDRQLHESRVIGNINKFKKILDLKKKNPNTYWTALMSLHQESFCISFDTQLMDMQQDTTETPVNTVESIPDSAHYESVSAPVFFRSSSPKRLKRDCDNCVRKNRTIACMQKKNKNMQEQVRALKKKLRDLPLKTLNEKIRRKSKSVDNWRARHSGLRAVITGMERKERLLRKTEKKLHVTDECLKTCMNENRALKTSSKELTRGLKKSHKKVAGLIVHNVQDREKSAIKYREVQAKLRDVREDCVRLENEIVEFQDAEDEEGSNLIATMNEGKYDYKLRQCIYGCLLSNVSVANVSRLLSSISGITVNKKFAKLPSVSTIAQMAYEVGVLSNIQAGHMLHECYAATLSWDSTTKAGAHINEVGLSLATEHGRQSLTLNVSHISDGTAESLYKHVIQAVSDVTEVYCDAFKLPVDAFRKAVASKIHSTMSDRAAANHCVNRRLQDDFGGDEPVADLKCMMHPLDGLARSARTALHSLETGHSTDQGRQGCRAAELIHQISKLRFKDGPGDPAAFNAFMEERKINPGIFERYVGNRLNVMFRSARVIYDHRQHLKEFVQPRTDRFLCKQIYQALNDPMVIVHLHVLGIYSHFLTAPWMQVFYTQDNVKQHLEAIKDVKTCLERLGEIEATPKKLIDATKDAFDKEISMDSVLDDKFACNAFFPIVKTLATCFIKTLSQQFKPYLEGPLSNPSAELISNTVSAPLHNMHAERTLGMVDSQLRRAPNATLGFIDAKVKAVQNKTMCWLQSFDEDFQKSLVNFAIRRGSLARQQQAGRQREVQQAVFQRVDKRMRDRHEKDITAHLKETRSVLSVLDMDLFNNLDTVTKIRLRQFLVDDRALSGMLLRHVWHEEGQETVYMEMIKSVKQKDNLKSTMEVLYWKEHETPSNATYPTTMKEFLVDFGTGELTFCDN